MINRFRFLTLVGSAALMAWCLDARGAITTQYSSSETFQSAASAAAAGWTALNYPFVTPPDSLGFSSTNNTLGSSSAGEGGGEMRRGSRSYYGDVTLAGVIRLNQRIESQGEYVFTSRSAGFNSVGFPTGVGHFDSARGTDNNNTLQFTINEEGVGSPTKFRVLARSFLNSGTFAWSGGSETATGTTAGTTWLTLDQGTPYWFETAWDPTIGNGQHRIEFFDNTNPVSPVSVGVITATMSAAVRASAEFGMTQFDAFGLRKLYNVPIDNANVATMFIDNVSYTVAPEPTALASLMLCGITCVGMRRRRSTRS